MRLLVFTPTYQLPDGTDAMAPECAAAIAAQRIDGVLDWQIGRYNPFPGYDHRNVLAQYQLAREMALTGDYDALLTVEHDNVLPDPEAVQRLLDTPGDVVYAPYVLRHGSFVLSTWAWLNGKNLGQSLTLHPPELAAAREAKMWRVCGVGMGCTLFHRTALETIPFRGGEKDQHAPDIPFAIDALAAHLLSIARMDVPVLHKQGEDWLHPYMTVGLKRYYCRVTVNAMVRDGGGDAHGDVVRLVEGEYVELLPRQAHDLVRAGFITIEDERRKELETATAEPDAERAVMPPAQRRKGGYTCILKP